MSKFVRFTPEDIARGRQAAAKEMAPALKFIRFNDVAYILIGNANTAGTSANDTSCWIAATDQACVVYNLFTSKPGKPVRLEDFRRYNMIKIKDPGKPFIPKDQWPLNKKNEPQHPWNRQVELPLLRLGDDGAPDGQVVVVQASVKSLRAQIGTLVSDYLTTFKRPFVTLIVEEEDQHKFNPKIRITGHSDDESDLLEFDGGFDNSGGGNSGIKSGDDNISTGSSPKKDGDDSGSKSGDDDSDMDDDIPF